MDTIRSVLSLAVFLISSLALPSQVSSDTSIGVWPWLVGDIDSYQNEIIAKAQSTGLDTIYISVWRTTGPRYGNLHIVDEAGSWQTADGQLQPRVTLSTFVARAHAVGIQVVGVIKVFDDTALPSDRAHQDHVVTKVIRYLVHSYHASGAPVYPLDGIALDYIRWFGGNRSPVEVNRFLDATRAEVGPLPIHAYVIAGPYALDGGSYTNTFRSYAGLRSYLSQNYGQDWEAMAARVDCLMPMTYIADGGVYGSNLAWMEGYTRQAAAYARAAVAVANPGCRVVLAVRTWSDSAQTTTRATVEASCRGAIAGGANGFMAFRYFTARGHNDWFQGLQNFSLPGQDLPIARITAAATGTVARVDSGPSFHPKLAQSSLRVEVDFDGDGRFESGPGTLGTRSREMIGVAPRVVSARVIDPIGQVGVARWRLAPPPILTASQATVSILAGGRVRLPFDPGASQSRQSYALFVSLSGTTPGTRLGPILTVPLNADPLTFLVYSGGNTTMFQGFVGALDGAGAAVPVFDVAGGVIPAALLGSQIHLAAVGVDRSSGQPRFVSNPVSLKIGF